MNNKIKIYLLAFKMYKICRPLYSYCKLYKKYDYDTRIISSSLGIAINYLTNHKSLYNLCVNNHFLRGVYCDIQYFLNANKDNALYGSLCLSFKAILKDILDKYCKTGA